MMFFHIIYLSSQNRGLVTHGSLIEVIFQNKAPFFNETPMKYRSLGLKKGHVWTQIRKLFPCSKNPRDSHTPARLPTYSWQMLSKKHSNIVEFFEFYEVATFHPMWPDSRGAKKCKNRGFKYLKSCLFVVSKFGNGVWYILFVDMCHYSSIGPFFWMNEPVSGINLVIWAVFLSCFHANFCGTSFYQQGFEGHNTSSSVQLPNFWIFTGRIHKKTSLVESKFDALENPTDSTRNSRCFHGLFVFWWKEWDYLHLIFESGNPQCESLMKMELERKTGQLAKS